MTTDNGKTGFCGQCVEKQTEIERLRAEVKRLHDYEWEAGTFDGIGEDENDDR